MLQKNNSYLRTAIVRDIMDPLKKEQITQKLIITKLIAQKNDILSLNEVKKFEVWMRRIFL